MAKGDQDQWMTARKSFERLGFIPHIFPQTVSALVKDHFQNKKSIKPTTKYKLIRLLRSDNFRSLLYYAAEALAEDEVKDAKAFTLGDLVSLHQPLDIAVIVSCYVVSRRLRKSLTQEQWLSVESDFYRDGEIGAQVGVLLPSVGLAAGLMVGALRHLAYGMMIPSKPSAYGKYREHLREKKIKVDEKFEESQWGCSSQQVTTLLLAGLGFGVDVSEAYLSGVESTLDITDIQSDLRRSFRVASIWFGCLAERRDVPQERIPSEYFPFPRDKERAEKRIEYIRQGGRSWLSRDRNDIGENVTPQLFSSDSSAEAVKNNLGKVTEMLELPDELKDVFSIAELTSMKEEEFDSLLHYIEEEESEDADTDDISKLDEVIE